MLMVTVYRYMFLNGEFLTNLQLGLCLHMLHSKVVKRNTKVRLDVVSSFDLISFNSQ